MAVVNKRAVARTAGQTNSAPTSSSKPKTTNTYDVTTQKGIDIAQNMITGDSWVNSDGHTWTKNNDGSITATTPGGNNIPLTINGQSYSKPAQNTIAPSMPNANYNDYYDKYLQEQQNAIQQRINSAVQANNAYIPQVNQRSDKALQEAYIAREMARVNAPQALSAMGHSGGASETALLGINTNYENSRNNIDQSRNQTLNDIYQNEQQIRATGNADLSNAAASYYDKLAQAQQQAIANAQAQANWQAEFDARQSQSSIDNAYRQTVYDYNLQQDLLKSGGISSGISSGGVARTSSGTTNGTTGGTSNVNMTKVNQVINGLGNFMLSQGTNEALVKNIQERVANGSLTSEEAEYILRQFRI